MLTPDLSIPHPYLSCTHTQIQDVKSKSIILQPFHHLLTRIADIYNTSIQDLSHWLYRQGRPFAIPSFITAALLGEPVVSIKRGIDSYAFNWKYQLKQNGIYDVADPITFKQLKNYCKITSDPQKHAVLLLHGTLSHPSVFYYWAKELDQAVANKKIGPVFTLQLPDDMEKRMDLVYKTIDAIHGFFKNTKIDIIGHSLGGFAGHLAQIKPEHIQIKDENGAIRRWHSIDPSHRNKKVGKVVAVAAPTWLCCKGQKDETTAHLKIDDTYPLKVFTEKEAKAAFTPEQLSAIQHHHPDLLDIIATQDAISPIVSPLAEDQIVRVNHKHVGIMHCSEVAKIAIDFLAKETPASKPSEKPLSLFSFKRLFT